MFDKGAPSLALQDLLSRSKHSGTSTCPGTDTDPTSKALLTAPSKITAHYEEKFLCSSLLIIREKISLKNN